MVLELEPSTAEVVADIKAAEEGRTVVDLEEEHTAGVAVRTVEHTVVVVGHTEVVVRIEVEGHNVAMAHSLVKVELDTLARLYSVIELRYLSEQR